MPIVISDGGLRIGSCRIRWGEQTTKPNLDIIAPHLRPYLTIGDSNGGLRPDGMYDYISDGNQNYIVDGGRDMFDGGNYTQQVYGVTLGYSQITSKNVNNGNINFDFISLGYRQGLSPDVIPLTMLSVVNSPGYASGFYKSGNLGADGYGFVTSKLLYSGSLLNNFTTYAFMRLVSGAGDAQVCDLYILLGHKNWGSTFTNTIWYSEGDTNSQFGYLYSYGTNILSIVTLLSPTSAYNITESTCMRIVQNYTNLIGQVI